jgi:hypothetical protein
LQDEFYLQVMESALAFFGSKVLCPSRKLFAESEIYDRYMRSPEDIEREGWDLRRYVQMLDFIVLHKDYERNRRKYVLLPELLSDAMEFDSRRKQELVRMLGHALGSSLYRAYVSGGIGKRWLRQLFLKDISRPGFARALYFGAADLARRGCSEEGCEW